MSVWNPWHGCHKISEGCRHCYIHKGDYKRKVETNRIVKTNDFFKPVMRNKNGSYKMKSGIVYCCFESDFLIEEADEWRNECWKMMKERNDCTFLFLTKRIERFLKCIPDDWQDGYENVVVYCTIEDQISADKRLLIFKDLPIKHKGITVQPLLERIEIDEYLDTIEEVVVGGENDVYGRILDYDWVLEIREACIKNKVNFIFRQCATHFRKDGKDYHLKTKDLCAQAKKANINIKYEREKENGI